MLANGAAGYTNELEVVVGDTIDFVTGRGADDHVQGSGLKIKGFLTLLEARQSPPRIVQQPRNQTVVAGGDLEFVVRAAGSTPLEYQWFHEGSGIAGATSATLTLNDVQPSQAGAYTVRVRNSLGEVTGGPATLTVRTANSYDLERDYTGTNPAGAWSYGWFGTLAGPFNPMTFHATTPEGIDYWLATTRVPSVYHNG